ncbi:MAG: hypothetical protein H0U76_26465, partial [Ktedonobacteraceae bacterium]|nr:hypothetical protein [Ktedonobacteraceae bacterium]
MEPSQSGQPDTMPDRARTSTSEHQGSSIFSDVDLYLFGQGKEYRIYEKMG